MAERADDPLSQSVAWALVVAGLAGLILSMLGVILGAATDLRDDRGELADLETQGVPPSGLRALVLARTAWLVIGGAVAGLAVGVVLTAVVTSALALTAEGTVPMIANPLKMSATPPSYRHSPPTLGQHTDEVLAELLGLDEAERGRLREAGAIG